MPRPRHRQVGAGRLAILVGDVDPHDTRGGVSANTKATPHQDLARAAQVSRMTATGLVPYTRRRSIRRARRTSPGGSTPSLAGPDGDTDALAVCTTRAAAPSPFLDEASAIPDAVWDTVRGALTRCRPSWSGRCSATRRATPRSANASHGASSLIAGARSRSISRSVSMTNKVPDRRLVRTTARIPTSSRPRARRLPRTGRCIHRWPQWSTTRARAARRGSTAPRKGIIMAWNIRPPGRRPDRHLSAAASMRARSRR